MRFAILVLCVLVCGLAYGVNEPATLTLLALGLCAFAVIRLRKRHTHEE